MKDVKAECDVIVVMFWKDYLNSNRESWLKGLKLEASGQYGKKMR